MKNIIKIIKRDFKNIKMNVVAIVVLLGLCLLPSLYAWFNISSNWDPYGQESTHNLKVAVYSEDKGYDLGNLNINMGDSIVDTLKTESTIGWTFEDSSRDAINGVYSGKYYAAVIIPEDFTSGVTGIIDGKLDGAKIKFYENEKKNAIATKITSKAQTALKTQINSEVFGKIAEISLNAAEFLKSAGEESNYADETKVKLNEMRSGLQTNIDTLRAVQKTADTATSALQNTIALSEKIVSDAQNDFSEAASGAVTLSGLEKANVRIEDYIDVIAQGSDSVGDTIALLRDLQGDIDTAIDNVNELENSEEVDKVLTMLKNSPEEFGTYLSDLVNVKTVPVYKTVNNGSMMSSFYTTLAIWVGALILVAILKTKVHPLESGEKLWAYQKFFGRYAIFFVAGQIQTIVCVMGNLFYLQIQCLHPFLYWLAGAATSFVFTIFIYALTFALGNIGEAVAVVIMVIQVAGAGGTFAVELLPEVFQKIYAFMPFNYAMNAMRECVSGMYENNYWIYIGKLMIFAGAALVIGIALHKPFERLNEIIEESKEKTDLMV